MKKILVPMDFSFTSENALSYAIKSHSNEEIIVLHVYNGLYSRTKLYLKPGMPKSEVIYDELALIVAELTGQRNWSERIKIVVREGDILSEIKHAVEEFAIDEVIMGTRDKYDLVDRMLGTVSLAAVKSLALPVYLIPVKAKYNGYNAVLAAIDQRDNYRDITNKVKEWNKKRNTFIKFINIDVDKTSFFKSKDRLIHELLDREPIDSGFEVSVLTRGKVSKSLVEMAHSERLDLIVLFSKKEHILNSVFFKSLSKELILSSDVPLLFL